MRFFLLQHLGLRGGLAGLAFCGRLESRSAGQPMAATGDVAGLAGLPIFLCASPYT